MPKITSYAGFTPILTDLLYGVDDPGGTPISNKMTIAALRDLIDPNLTRAYGVMSVQDGSTGESTVDATPRQIAAWNNNGISTGVTPAHDNDIITIDTNGDFKIALAASFSGTASKTFHMEIRKNGFATGYADERKLSAGGDVGAAGIVGILDLKADDTLSVYQHSTDGGSALTVIEAQLAVHRIGSSWHPNQLFDAGQVGVIYLPDLSTTWQDSGRSTPGVKDNPVGAQDDESGNDDHALQATGSKRPILRQTAGGHWYLEADGVDDFLRATFTYAQPIDRISALRVVARTGSDQLIGGVVANAGAMFISTNINIGLYSGVVLEKDGTVIGTDYVFTERHAGASSRVTFNNVSYTTGNAGSGLGGGLSLFSNNLGADNANSHLYGTVMGSFSTLSDAQIQQARNFMARRAGITL